MAMWDFCMSVLFTNQNINTYKTKHLLVLSYAWKVNDILCLIGEEISSVVYRLKQQQQT